MDRSILRQSRAANIAFLLLWITICAVAAYYVATYFHTMSPSSKVFAGLGFVGGLGWIRLAIHALRAEEE